jgi:hypothetical protein
MKNKTIASKVEKSWTVLLVDGQGRIRRIRHFRQKFWAIVGLSVGAIVLTAVMGTLYGGTLRKQMALSDQVDALQEEIAAIQQQNEVLKARAVRMEAQVAKSTKSEPKPATTAAAARKSAQKLPRPERGPKKSDATDRAGAKPPPAAAEPTPVAAATVAKPEKKSLPKVDVEGLKVTYLADTEHVEAQFVIKNIGQVPAGGRAVVVLHTKENSSPLRLAVPSVLLRDGQPVGNRGRRFSISRFMRMRLQRKFAEPGTSFVRAVVYAYTLDGKPLLEKPFEVSLDIPKKDPPPEAASAPPSPSDDSDAMAAPLGLTLPPPKTQEDSGVQP